MDVSGVLVAARRHMSRTRSLRRTGVTTRKGRTVMDQQVVSFDLRDKAEIDLSRSRGGFPRVTVSAVSVEDDPHGVEHEVEFVHTRDSDPLVSLAFFRSLSDQARQAAEMLADLVSDDAARNASSED
jgi:hypothetical protein